MTIKILNAYAGIGGNRKVWDGDILVTAVEYDPEIARAYQSFFPNDTVIVADAHQYLLDNYMNFDFIWCSPPCPSHSDIRRCGVHRGQYLAIYPDMSLYQEIILLQTFFKGLYCVENVIPYYKPLISAQERGRHLYWANFYISEFEKVSDNIGRMNIEFGKNKTGFDLTEFKVKDARKAYRNCVDSKLGKHIFDCAFKNVQTSLLLERDQ